MLRSFQRATWQAVFTVGAVLPMLWAPSELAAQRYERQSDDFAPEGPLYDEDVVGPWYDLDRYGYQIGDYGLYRRPAYDPFENAPGDEGMYGPRGLLDPGPYGGYAYGFYDRLIGGNNWFYDYYDYGSDYGAILDFGDYGQVPEWRRFR